MLKQLKLKGYSQFLKRILDLILKFAFFTIRYIGIYYKAVTMTVRRFYDIIVVLWKEE